MVERRAIKRGPAARSGPRKKRRSSSSCCYVDFEGCRVVSLDDDVLTEILARLPAKTVTRFQSVCKSWLSLICTHHFRSLRSRRGFNKTEPSLVFEKRECQPPLLYFCPKIRRNEKRMKMTPFNIISNSKILSCSNGLMLLQCDYDYYVHNPATKQSRKLSLANNDKYIHIDSLHLLFDPSKSLHYKIVCVRAEYEPLLRKQIEVFNSESGTWRVCKEPFTGGEKMSIDTCVECNSLIYLMYRHTYFGCFYYFDIVKNVSDIILVPQLARGAYAHTIQESNGCLYYFALLREASVALWELVVNNDNPRHSKWLLKYLRTDQRLQDGLGLNLLILIAETSTILIHVPGKIMAYNLGERSYKELLHLEPQISSLNFHYFGLKTLALL